MQIKLLSSQVQGETRPLSPELQAAVLARYSRSNDGLDAILATVDETNEEKSIERIFKFTDYGHASIGGLTGTITLALDDVTMVMAYMLFAAAPHADGQESSTRYIRMDESSLPGIEQVDMQPSLYAAARKHWLLGMEIYHKLCADLDTTARLRPELTRLPADLPDKVRERMLKNFAFDRARNFLPFALKTNIALTQTARAWVDTCAKLLSLGMHEPTHVANQIIDKLKLVAPHLIKHAKVKSGLARHWGFGDAVPNCCGDNWDKAVLNVMMVGGELSAADLAGRENRYDACSPLTRRSVAQFYIPKLAVAELRDLNRHRKGEKQADLWAPSSFELPEFPEFNDPSIAQLIEDYKVSYHALLDTAESLDRPWLLSLGSTVPFMHTMSLDTFVYIAELRTGPGAHFRYAQHLRDAVSSLYDGPLDSFARAIQLGEAEPE
jgi:thymidylate synthase ThyX